MIKGGMFGVKWLIVGGMAFFLMLLIGCQEEGLPDEEGAEVSLSRVPNNPGFASLPLIGTPWKLLGFVDKRTNKIKLATPFIDKSYTLHFMEKGDMEGFTSNNIVWTTYSLHPADKNGLDLSLFRPSTYAGETDEGYLYIELMKKVNSYRISNKGLELYYDSHLYLLFQPME